MTDTFKVEDGRVKPDKVLDLKLQPETQKLFVVIDEADQADLKPDVGDQIGNDIAKSDK